MISPIYVDDVSVETWEGFSQELLSWGIALKDSENIDEDSKKKWERSRFDKLEKDGWIGIAQEAWTRLDTEQRAQALELIFRAGQEALHEHRTNPQIWQETKKERESRSKKLRRSRGQAETAVNQAVMTLQKYKDVALAVEESHPNSDPAYINVHPEHIKEAYKTSNRIGGFLTEIRKIAKQLEKILLPTALMKAPGQRGRRQRKALNEARQGLTKLFHDCGMLASEASMYTNALLYLAGLSNDVSSSGLRAKVASLGKRPQFPS